MAWKSNGAILLTVLAIPSAEAMTLFDPKLCYILDGFLMFYGVMITALFVRERCCRPKTPKASDSAYASLQKKRPEDNYEQLRHNRGDVETGSGRGRRQDEDSTYSRLNPNQEDPYRAIQTKKDRHRKDDQVYQDLKGATKDTYAKLQPRHQQR